MAKNEVSVGGEVAFLGVVPIGGKVSASVKRTWESRSLELVTEVSQYTGMTLEELQAKVEGDREDLRDLLSKVVTRVVEEGASDYRTALARLLAAAFSNTEILEVKYVTDQIVRLDPLHLRVLFAAYDFRGRQGMPTAPVKAAQVQSHKIDSQGIAGQLGISRTLASAAIGVLSAAHFLVPDDDAARDGDAVTTTALLQPDLWHVTDLANLALKIMFPALTEASW